MKKLFLLCSLGLLTISCENKLPNKLQKKDIDLNGNWEYLGFGKGIRVTDSAVNGYHLTSIGNVSTYSNSLKEFFDYYTTDTLSNDTILLKDGVKTFKLFRSDKDFDSNVKENLADDPSYNFEVLWNTFNEQYCYFKERAVDWDAIYKKYKPQVTSKSTKLELYLVFKAMLEEIDDSHISMDVPDGLEEEYATYSEKEESTSESENTGELQKSIRKQIVDKYLVEPKNFNRGSITYGHINKDIGYIEVQNMIAMAHYPIADSLSNDQFWEQWWANLNKAKNYHDDVKEGTRFMMDAILEDLRGVKAIIIDIRFNGGGFDDASFEILNHFTSMEILVNTKKVRLGDGFTEKQKMSLYPSKKPFTGALYVLTSYQTASAAEVLVLGSKEIPNSKIIGSTTEGVFSDILSKKLPNGWSYGLSNMIYESMKGVSYENIGIKPDHVLDYPKDTKAFLEYLEKDLKDGDNAIEKVISENQ